MFNRILLCSDGSERSIQAAEVAASLARTMAAKLTLLHVSPLPEIDEPFPGAPGIPKGALESYAKARHRAVIERTLPAIEAAGATCEILEDVGDPADVILRIADFQEYGLIVMGSRGLRSDKAAELGSVSREVLQRAHCPVLVVK